MRKPPGMASIKAMASRARRSSWGSRGSSPPSHYDLDYVEYRVIRRDGTVRWIEDYGHFANIPSAGGIFYVFLGDATEKRDRLDLEAPGGSP